jgi:hypothetical protein
MAKKVSKKKKAKSPKRRVSSAREQAETSVGSVVHFLRMLGSDTEAFIAAADAANARVIVTADSMAFIRERVNSRRGRLALAANVADPCPNDPFRCFPR